MLQGIKIVIHTDLDLTPAGKRTARIGRPVPSGQRLCWYVAGRIYRQLPMTKENVQLTHDWIAAA